MARSRDVEGILHCTGKRVGMRLLEVFGFDREIDISGLLYKITYILLPQVYETSRKVESFREKKNTFIITEDQPLLGTYVSCPESGYGFSADTLLAGVIESAIRATGYISTVNAYTTHTASLNAKTIYFIELKSTEVLFDDY